MPGPPQSKSPVTSEYFPSVVNFFLILFQHRCGLPISKYFSAVKIKWMMENCPDVIKAMEEGNCLFGTVDTWLIWVREEREGKKREREWGRDGREKGKGRERES